MNPKTRLGTALALAALLVAVPLFAFDYPLSPEAIREAYFLGKGDAQKRAAFLARYAQMPPLPESGPHVAIIRFETPYVVILNRMAQMPNDHAPDAEQEFLGKPAICRVLVEINLTASYGPQFAAPSGGVRLRSDDFWKDFTIRLIQDGKEIPAKSVRGRPIYTASGDSPSQLSGADVTLEYAPGKIASAPAEVKVSTPDGQDVSATFDLGTLR